MNILWKHSAGLLDDLEQGCKGKVKPFVKQMKNGRGLIHWSYTSRKVATGLLGLFEFTLVEMKEC